MTFTHKRSHGGKSSAQLVREAADLHRALGDIVLALRVYSPEKRAKARRLMRRAFTRFCRREVRLEIQEEQEHIKALLPMPDLDSNEGRD